MSLELCNSNHEVRISCSSASALPMQEARASMYTPMETIQLSHLTLIILLTALNLSLSLYKASIHFISKQSLCCADRHFSPCTFQISLLPHQQGQSSPWGHLPKSPFMKLYLPRGYLCLEFHLLASWIVSNLVPKSHLATSFLRPPYVSRVPVWVFQAVDNGVGLHVQGIKGIPVKNKAGWWGRV